MPKAPGPKGHWLMGSIAEFKSIPDLFEGSQEYGDVVSLRLATTKSVLVTHPEHIQHVLKTNRANTRSALGASVASKSFWAKGFDDIDEKNGLKSTNLACLQAQYSMAMSPSSPS